MSHHACYLWKAEQQGETPGQQYERVPALCCTTAVRLQGAADRIVAIYCHGHNHVGRGEHPQNLEVFHQAAQEVWAWKAPPGVPHQLRQHLMKENRREKDHWGYISLICMLIPNPNMLKEKISCLVISSIDIF